MCRENFPGMHKHHIVFKSQGGLDFSLNLIRLTQEGHEGDKGPHRDRGRDLELKRALQAQLTGLFPEGEFFTVGEVAEKLGRTERYFAPHFKRVPTAGRKHLRREVVKRLMGGRFY